MQNVDAIHPSYAKSIERWKRCRDCRSGEDAVKAAKEKYLPRLSGQSPADYDAYRARAMFYSVTGRTVEAFKGALFIKPPQVTTHKDVDALKSSIGVNDEDLTAILDQTADELITLGRVGLLIDAETVEGAMPYVAIYPAESIINWQVDRSRGQAHLTLVVLQEDSIEQDPDDPYLTVAEQRWRVLELTETGEYQVTVYRKDTKKNDQGQLVTTFEQVEQFTPRRRGGAALDYIPFVIVNTNSISTRIDKPPILDLANVNLSHYRTSADLEHGRHYTALPTPYAIGVDTKTTELRLGSGTAWLIPNPQASVGFLEFTGSGLGSLAQGMEEKQQMMAALGSRLLYAPKRGIESADTVRLNASAESSVLGGMARMLSDAFSQVLWMIEDWLLLQDDESPPTVVIHADYAVLPTDSATIMAVMDALQRNLISEQDWVDFLKHAGLISKNRTLEEHRVALQQKSFSGGPLI